MMYAGALLVGAAGVMLACMHAVDLEYVLWVTAGAQSVDSADCTYRFRSNA